MSELIAWWAVIGGIFLAVAPDRPTLQETLCIFVAIFAGLLIGQVSAISLLAHHDPCPVMQEVSK